jgi:transposase-like protein
MGILPSMNRVDKLYSAQEECQVQTIQEESTSLDKLTDDQDQKYRRTLDALTGRTYCSCRRPLVTYRGVSRDHLVEKLSKQGSHLSEVELLSLLFYFGDKAKHYYKIDNIDARSLRWLSSIEDKSQSTCETIFKKIGKVLKNKRAEIKRFIERNHDFCEYFKSGSNSEGFGSAVSALGQDARDYYLYFLHSVGKIGLGDKSVLVSTSRSYDAASRFAGDANGRYVIYYIIPKPILNYAVSHLSMKILENKLNRRGLPIYNGDAIYPDQKEYCVRGALFPSHIFGVQVLDDSRFVVNPHLFSGNNNVCDMLNGLALDQSDFEGRLKNTNYYRGVGTIFDGNHLTINRA